MHLTNVQSCDSYTLPALTVGNYFDGTNGTGTAYSAGDIINATIPFMYMLKLELLLIIALRKIVL